MKLKNLKLKKKVKLFINNIEMAFSNSFGFNDHTSNFSSFTFSDVIPKDKNNYKDIVKIWNYGDEFQIGKVYFDDELVFFGVVAATGRLSLFPNQPKTKSIQIMDFRKFLSLKKPVELLFFKEKPEKIVTQLIKGMREDKIIVGTLDFTNSDIINAYSTFGKTPYQVLKEIIAKQTDSLLYFKIEADEKISVNFKSDATIRNEEKITLNIENLTELKKYGVLDIELDTNADKYANIINYESENIISNILRTETLELSTTESINLFYNVGKISKDPNDIFIIKKGDTAKNYLVVKNQQGLVDGEYYDVLYSTGKNTLKVNKKWLNSDYVLYFGYFPKLKNSVQLSNYEEQKKVANFSGTAGDIYKYEKFNDISDLNDLLRMCQGDLNISSIVDKNINITTENGIWNVGDTVNIISENQNISGLYLVIACDGKITASAINDNINFSQLEFNYLLRNSKNADLLVNQFDNQSYKTNPAIDEDSIFETTASIDGKVLINLETKKTKATADEEAIAFELEN